METLTDQLYAFFLVLLSGVLLGLFFDCYRLFRQLLKPRKHTTFVCDLLFFVLVTPLLLFSALLANGGALRLYVILGFSFGVALYLLLFSRVVLALFGGLLQSIQRILATLLTLFASVFRVPLYMAQDRKFLPRRFLRPHLRWKKQPFILRIFGRKP